MKHVRYCLSFCLMFGLVFIISAASMSAQALQFKGKVLASEGRAPIVGASIKAIHSTTGAVRGAYSDARGRFTIKNLEPGVYNITVTCVGYEATAKGDVDVSSTTSEVEFAMSPTYIDKDATIVTASRSSEEVVDAPVAVSVVDRRTIEETPSQTSFDYIKALPGVESSQKGISGADYSTRGYNSVFTAAMMVLQDFRLTNIPSLRANIPYFTPASYDDIDRIELVRGPGSALYGPNANYGVMNVISRSPFSSQGTSIFATGGFRSATDVVGDNGNYYSHVGLRHAGTLGDRVGYKISGQYFNAWDWVFVDSVEQASREAAIAAGANPDTLLIGKRDNIHRRYNVEARVDYLPSDNSSISLSGGLTTTISNIETNGIGAAQGRNWMYSFVNASAKWDELFAQFFVNMSQSGETYNLRTGLPVIDNSNMIGARLQHRSFLGDWIKLSYGADFFATNPVTDSTISGMFEEDDNFTEIGGYVQGDIEIVKEKLNLVLAGRVDKHSVIADPMISPRAALIYKLMEDQSVRVSYNRAYATPTTPQLFLDILSQPDVFGLSAYNPAWAVGAYGASLGRDGFTFARDGAGPTFYSQFNRTNPLSLGAASSGGVWQTATQLVIGGIQADTTLDANTKAQLSAFLNGVPANTTIKGNMALLNTETGTFTPTADVQDRTPMIPENFQSFEVGYQGVIEQKVRITLDGYYTIRQDIISNSRVITPNVFLDSAATKDYLKPMMKQGLMQQGVPEPQAEAMAEAYTAQLGSAYASIPVGTVSPNENPHKGDLLFTSVNLGEIDFFGLEVGVNATLTDWLDLSGSANYVSQNYWTAEEAKAAEDYSGNVPQYRASLGLLYRNPGVGLNTGLRWRWSDSFRMISGVYQGSVSAYNLLDLTVQYRFSSIEGLEATLSVTNLLDNRVQQWVGAPAIGRLSTLQLRFSL